MKLIPLLVASLLPIGLSASPIASADNLESRNPGDVLNPRTDGICRIVNAPSGVNCRSGPGTGYKVVQTLKNGLLLWYPCYKSGECVTLNGAVNWYVFIVPQAVNRRLDLGFWALADQIPLPQRLALRVDPRLLVLCQRPLYRQQLQCLYVFSLPPSNSRVGWANMAAAKLPKC